MYSGLMNIRILMNKLNTTAVKIDGRIASIPAASGVVVACVGPFNASRFSVVGRIVTKIAPGVMRGDDSRRLFSGLPRSGGVCLDGDVRKLEAQPDETYVTTIGEVICHGGNRRGRIIDREV